MHLVYEGLYGQDLNPVSLVQSNLECTYNDSPGQDTSTSQVPSQQFWRSLPAEAQLGKRKSPSLNKHFMLGMGLPHLRLDPDITAALCSCYIYALKKSLVCNAISPRSNCPSSSSVASTAVSSARYSLSWQPCSSMGVDWNTSSDCEGVSRGYTCRRQWPRPVTPTYIGLLSPWLLDRRWPNTTTQTNRHKHRGYHCADTAESKYPSSKFCQEDANIFYWPAKFNGRNFGI